MNDRCFDLRLSRSCNHMLSASLIDENFADRLPLTAAKSMFWGRAAARLRATDPARMVLNISERVKSVEGCGNTTSMLLLRVIWNDLD